MQPTIAAVRFVINDALTCAIFVSVALTLVFPDAALSSLGVLMLLRWLVLT